MHKWEEYSIDNIIGGKSSDGVSLLKLFLQDYSKLFHTTTLNAGCQKCLQDYLTNYKNKINKMENPNASNYRLKQKYQNIPLEFGSNIFVNNNNITDEYAEKLLERYDAEKIFEVYPQPTEKTEVVEETTEQETTEATTENVEQPKQKRTRKSRK